MILCKERKYKRSRAGREVVDIVESDRTEDEREKERR
jgi:hypothetical protein